MHLIDQDKTASPKVLLFYCMPVSMINILPAHKILKRDLSSALKYPKLPAHEELEEVPLPQSIRQGLRHARTVAVGNGSPERLQLSTCQAPCTYICVLFGQYIVKGQEMNNSIHISFVLLEKSKWKNICSDVNPF